MYLRGRAVERDLARAWDLFPRAANLGYAAAQNNLALMYAKRSTGRHRSPARTIANRKCEELTRRNPESKR
jgi:TPR repeat protein